MAAKVYQIILIQVDLDLILVAVQAIHVVLLLVPILQVRQFLKSLAPLIGEVFEIVLCSCSVFYAYKRVVTLVFSVSLYLFQSSW